MLIAAALIVAVVEYLTCPVYRFDATEPFQGNVWYNPYDSLEGKIWLKGNFQIQSRAWAGITSGRGNSNEDIESLYRMLGYDIIATSDYQRINRYGEGSGLYIPVYEHGYSIPKTHQVLLGASEVLWRDYPLFQTIHNKQDIINRLRPANRLIFLAHPLLRNGYKISDMQYLGGYDGIEVLNNYRTSTGHWDAALSAGNYVTLLSNDDAHDISNPDEIGHHCTLIAVREKNSEEVISALKRGCAVGAKIERPHNEPWRDKAGRHKRLPVIRSVLIRDKILSIVSEPAPEKVRFIGQDGTELGSVSGSDSVSFDLTPVRSYVRAELAWNNGITYYLNPVCRTVDGVPAYRPVQQVDRARTNIFLLIGWATFITILVNIIWFWRKKRMNNVE
ncbi:MAG: hypothetical protein Kow00127_14120 [Bacteroidales bacterium]